MSLATPDEDIIIVPDSLNADDDDGHWICIECWPDYVPGRVVIAVCGALSEDCPAGSTDGDGDCATCDDMLYCPRCGEPVKDGTFPERYL